MLLAHILARCAMRGRAHIIQHQLIGQSAMGLQPLQALVLARLQNKVLVDVFSCFVRFIIPLDNLSLGRKSKSVKFINHTFHSAAEGQKGRNCL